MTLMTMPAALSSSFSLCLLVYVLDSDLPGLPVPAVLFVRATASVMTVVGGTAALLPTEVILAAVAVAVMSGTVLEMAVVMVANVIFVVVVVLVVVVVTVEVVAVVVVVVGGGPTLPQRKLPQFAVHL